MGLNAEKDAPGRRGCVAPKRHLGDAAMCATSCWQERIGKGHCPAEPLPDAEKNVPACRHCERPIRLRGSAWEHYPTGPNASGRGWQGRRCPGRLTVAEPSVLPPGAGA